MKIALKERDVARQICDMLRAHGWRVERCQVGLFQRPGSRARIRIGEVGQADYLALRSSRRFWTTPECEVFYFEVKAPGKVLMPSQRHWRDLMRKDGFVVESFDSREGFQGWYNLQGFGR